MKLDEIVKADVPTLWKRVNELTKDFDLPEDFDGEWDTLLIALVIAAVEPA